MDDGPVIYCDPKEYKCPCPGSRQFELLDDPVADDAPLCHRWYVCPCCGTRKLLPLKVEE